MMRSSSYGINMFNQQQKYRIGFVGKSPTHTREDTNSEYGGYKCDKYPSVYLKGKRGGSKMKCCRTTVFVEINSVHRCPIFPYRISVLVCDWDNKGNIQGCLGGGCHWVYSIPKVQLMGLFNKEYSPATCFWYRLVDSHVVSVILTNNY